MFTDQNSHLRFKVIIFACIFLSFSLGFSPALPIQVKPAVSGDVVSPTELLNPDGSLDMSTGFQGTLDLRGWEVSLDSQRGPLLKKPERSGYHPGSAWHALPRQGLNGFVQALAVSGSDLYVGGSFTETDDGALKDLGFIARYNTTTKTWHAMPNMGLNGDVWALAVAGSYLYVGGAFTATGDGTLNNLGYIARYNMMTSTWYKLIHEGLNHPVYDLAVLGGDLYVGGVFDTTGDGMLTNLGAITRYNINTNALNPLPNQGLNNAVNALVRSGSDLYVGGSFVQTGDGNLTNLGFIARFDTISNSWHALPKQGLNGIVMALAVSADDLYVGGWFSQTGDGALKDLGLIARYDTTTSTWHALANQGLNTTTVQVLTVAGGKLYVGGTFTGTGDDTLTNLGYIARYNIATGTWSALQDKGLNGDVRALAVVDHQLYIGGNFTQTGDGVLSNLSHIARYDTQASSWIPLPDKGLMGDVNALKVTADDLYVGGEFTQTGDGKTLTDLGNIAHYDIAANTWRPLPNQGLNGPVYALATFGDDLYMGGAFDQTSDGVKTNLGNIIRYNTKTGAWHSLSNKGLNDLVYALAVSEDDLYVGGAFSQTADGSVTNLGNIARYETKNKTWHQLTNNGLNDTVRALAVTDHNLYAGGNFTASGPAGISKQLEHIALFDINTNTWHALSNQGLNGNVFALVDVNNDLYVGGDFMQTSDGTLVGLGRIARYDMKRKIWHKLPNLGLGGTLRTMGMSGSDLYVGGEFTYTRDETWTNLGNIARYDTKGNKWHPLPYQGLNDAVMVLTASGENLFVGGMFSETGEGSLKALGSIVRLVLDVKYSYLPLVYKQ